MNQISEIVGFLKTFAPITLAEDWDNVGLLIGDEDSQVSAAMTCLTLTPDVAAEAIDGSAQLVISHHPLLFRPVQRLTADTPDGRMLLDLIAAGVAVYSPHTGYDSAVRGINQQLADLLELTEVTPLRPPASASDETSQSNSKSDSGSLGSGRCGNLPEPTTLAEFNEFVKQRLRIQNLQFVGDANAEIRRVGLACGSAAEFLRDAAALDCEVLLTGEARFHACLEAQALGVAMVLPGHYATERPAMERLARIIATQLPNVKVWASQRESDPVQWS